MSDTQIKPDKDLVNTQATTPLKGHKTALTFLVLAYMLSVADRMVLSILFPDIKAEFGLTDTQLGLLGGLTFAIFYATLGVPVARLADQYNRKLIILISLVTFSMMTVLSGFAMGFITLLILRIGVGIGEAGVNPSSHSIIADYYPPQKRSFAMALLAVGASAGMMIGFAGGGVIADAYNWRIALMCIGIPGVGLAIVMALFFREPPRGSFDGGAPVEKPPAILTSARTIWHHKALRHIVIGSTITGMFSYGISQWLPTYFDRIHELPANKTGMMMAGFFGLLGMLGAILSGKVTDKLSEKGFQYGVWLLSFVIVISVPFWLLAMFNDSLTVAMILLVIPAFTANYFFAPSFALVQTLSPVPMRAVASAITLLCINLIGLGLGPLTVGILSDLLTPSLGEKALSTAIAIFSLIGLWGALHYYLGGKHLAKLKSGG